jgi:hypothetical protein
MPLRRQGHKDTAMKPRPGRTLSLAAATALLSAAAGFDGPTAPAAGSPGATAVAVPADCAAFGCPPVGDPAQWAAFRAVDIATVFSRMPR